MPAIESLVVSACCEAPVETEVYAGNKSYTVCTGCGKAFCKTVKAKLSQEEQKAMDALRQEAEDMYRARGLTSFSLPYAGFAKATGDGDDYAKSPPAGHLEFYKEMNGVTFGMNIMMHNLNLVIQADYMGGHLQVEVTKENLDHAKDPNALIRGLQVDMMKKITREYALRSATVTTTTGGTGTGTISGSGGSGGMSMGLGMAYEDLASANKYAQLAAKLPKKEPFWKRSAAGNPKKDPGSIPF